MHLGDELILLGHGVKVPREAVDQYHLSTALIHTAPDLLGELAGREFARINLPHADEVYQRPQVHAQPFATPIEGLGALVEQEDRGALPPPGGGVDVERRHRGLAGAGRPHQEAGGALLQTAA